MGRCTPDFGTVILQAGSQSTNSRIIHSAAQSLAGGNSDRRMAVPGGNHEQLQGVTVALPGQRLKCSCPHIGTAVISTVSQRHDNPGTSE